MSKIKYPLIVFMQRSENDLQTELNLLRQAKKAVAKLLNSYVEAVNFNRQEDVLVLEKVYEDMAKAMFSGSSEIPPIRVSCGLDPVPAAEPPVILPYDPEKITVTGPMDDNRPAYGWGMMEQREIDGTTFVGRSEVLDAMEAGVGEENASE